MNELNQSYFNIPAQAELDSSVYITWAGHRICPSNHSVGPRVLEDFSIILVVNGKGTFIKEGKKESINKGDIMMLFPGVKHQYYADPEDPWEIYWVVFNGKIVHHIFDLLNITPKKPILRESYSHSLRMLLENIVLEFKKNDSQFHFKAKASLYLMLSVLFEKIPSNDSLNVMDVRMDEKEVISKIATFIELNYYKNISVEQISNYVNLSRSHLTRIFKKSTGFSLKQYIINCRMEKAKNLLDNTELNINEISLSIGIDDPYYFSRIFKTYEGISPSEYRKNH